MEAISINFYEAFLIGLHFESFMVFFFEIYNRVSGWNLFMGLSVGYFMRFTVEISKGLSVGYS